MHSIKYSTINSQHIMDLYIVEAKSSIRMVVNDDGNDDTD